MILERNEAGEIVSRTRLGKKPREHEIVHHHPGPKWARVTAPINPREEAVVLADDPLFLWASVCTYQLGTRVLKTFSGAAITIILSVKIRQSLLPKHQTEITIDTTSDL
jgi:hypothetical protein